MQTAHPIKRKHAVQRMHMPPVFFFLRRPNFAIVARRSGVARQPRSTLNTRCSSPTINSLTLSLTLGDLIDAFTRERIHASSSVSEPGLFFFQAADLTPTNTTSVEFLSSRHPGWLSLRWQQGTRRTGGAVPGGPGVTSLSHAARHTVRPRGTGHVGGWVWVWMWGKGDLREIRSTRKHQALETPCPGSMRLRFGDAETPGP
jgi:hypothetical protein